MQLLDGRYTCEIKSRVAMAVYLPTRRYRLQPNLILLLILIFIGVLHDFLLTLDVFDGLMMTV
jgi:hypothetical protein